LIRLQTFSQILDLPQKNLPERNTLAYFATSSPTNRRGFVTLAHEEAQKEFWMEKFKMKLEQLRFHRKCINLLKDFFLDHGKKKLFSSKRFFKKKIESTKLPSYQNLSGIYTDKTPSQQPQQQGFNHC